MPILIKYSHIFGDCVIAPLLFSARLPIKRDLSTPHNYFLSYLFLMTLY